MSPAGGLTFGDLPAVVRRRLRGVLDPEEDILWVGAPSVREMMARELLMSGCAWLGLPLLVAAVAACGLTVGGGWIPWLVVLCLASLVSILLVLTILLGVPWQARRTAYVVTSRRALIARVDLSDRVLSYPPERLSAIWARVLPDGTGEVMFEEHDEVTKTTGIDGELQEARVKWAIGFVALTDVETPRQALEQLLGRPVPLEEVTSIEVKRMR